jgi:putative SOS response-associated peptidase YedK
MVAAYTFNTQYDPQGAERLPSLRLLEGGKFSGGQFAPVLVQEYQQMRLKYFRWGLVPAFAKAGRGDQGITFAPSDHLFRQPAYMVPIRRQRCLIPADGFYTSHEHRGSGHVFKLSRPEGDTFCFAGIYDTWRQADGSLLETFAIITVPSSQHMNRFGLQMPLILPSNVEGAWLSPYTDLNKIQKLVSLPMGTGLRIHPVQELRLPEVAPQHNEQVAA